MEKDEFVYGVEQMKRSLLAQATQYLGNSDDAEDVVQDVFMTLWVLKDRIPDMKRMRNMASVVCRNASLNKKRKSREISSLEMPDMATDQANAYEQMAYREDVCRLRRGVRALSSKHRAILRMRNVENMTYADMAKILGSTENSVRGMISKARMALLEQLKNER